MSIVINNCPYCSRPVPCSLFHPDCRMDYLESLLAEVVARPEGSELPKDLVWKIRKERPRTMDEIQKDRKAAADEEARKRHRDEALKKYLQDCAEEWKRKHPEDWKKEDLEYETRVE